MTETTHCQQNRPVVIQQGIVVDFCGNKVIFVFPSNVKVNLRMLCDFLTSSCGEVRRFSAWAMAKLANLGCYDWDQFWYDLSTYLSRSGSGYTPTDPFRSYDKGARGRNQYVEVTCRCETQVSRVMHNTGWHLKPNVRGTSCLTKYVTKDTTKLAKSFSLTTPSTVAQSLREPHPFVSCCPWPWS